MNDKRTNSIEIIKNKFGDLIKIGNKLKAKAKNKEFSGIIISIGTTRIKIISSDSRIWYIPYAMITEISKS